MEFKFTADVLNKIGDMYIAELTKNLLSLNKKASGNLINSLDYDVIKVVDGFLLELKAASYLRYVDSGRKPGKMPPPDDILKWVKVRNLKFRSPKGRFITQKATAFVIAKSIGKKGIKPTHVLQTTIDNIMKNRQELLTTAFKKDVKIILDDMLQKIRK